MLYSKKEFIELPEEEEYDKYMLKQKSAILPPNSAGSCNLAKLRGLSQNTNKGVFDFQFSAFYIQLMQIIYQSTLSTC